MPLKSDLKRFSLPCVYEFFNDRHEAWEKTVPDVDCDYRCDKCGWNPEVRERRMKAAEKRARKAERMREKCRDVEP